MDVRDVRDDQCDNNRINGYSSTTSNNSNVRKSTSTTNNNSNSRKSP